MPKVTDAHQEARREQILEAAFACFARQGFHQTTMQDICKEAGLSAGAVYGYFESKDAIIAATCGRCQEENLAVLERVSAHEETFEILDELVNLVFSDLNESGVEQVLQLNVQWWSESLRNAALREQLQKASFEIWLHALADIVRLGQSRGEFDSTIDPHAAARVLLAIWQGLVLQKALDPGVDVPSYLHVIKSIYGGTFARRNE